ncbi:MAG: type I pullulanase [Prolixibacteraceae bacterium]|nr:type I pullulanase [Prolixibacteraceae bacterium]
MRSWRFNHIDFSTYPNYGGDDLGVHWSAADTLFKIWAPTAHRVELRIYETCESANPLKIIELTKDVQGAWSHRELGNLENLYYTFRINDGEWLQETPDMYAKTVGVNGLRGMIFDLEKTNPQGWKDDKGPVYENFTDWIIYELHVRDFSISENSGINHKGKFLGFTEEATKSPLGEKTGLDHLKELGVTHVHLLPIFDFQTVDEENQLKKYNWGYDPQNFNAPEGSYSTNPYDGKVRVKELKELVKALHDNGIGVIMDMVYNHTYMTRGSVFNQTAPGYFYRQKPDGSFADASGCGNEMATERFMVRKYIIDSLLYWLHEYHIDGFRFDLMGVFDMETMQIIRDEIDKIKPGILLYGEGWAADRSPLGEEYRAVKQNISKMQGIAAFSDDMRDALRGNNNRRTRGFISGLKLREEAVKFGIVAATRHPQIVYGYVESSNEPWAAEPGQCVNYVSCHDNYTLYDKIKLSNLQASGYDVRRMVKLAGAIILTSQGIPFLHAGSEFCRTKRGNENSYNAPDSINQIEWVRKSVYKDVFEYYRKLVVLRRNHPVFRMPSTEMIQSNLSFDFPYQVGVISYRLSGNKTGDMWEEAIVVFNANNHPATLQLPDFSYKIIVCGNDVDENGLGEIHCETIDIEPVSMLLLARQRRIKF